MPILLPEMFDSAEFKKTLDSPTMVFALKEAGMLKPTFDNNGGSWRSFSFYIEGRDVILSSVQEIAATKQKQTGNKSSAALCKPFSGLQKIEHC